MCLCGGLILYIHARTPIEIRPFTQWFYDEFTSPWLHPRFVGFGSIALGVITMIGGYLWLRHLNSKR
jgi:hypothetical protein